MRLLVTGGKSWLPPLSDPVEINKAELVIGATPDDDDDDDDEVAIETLATAVDKASIRVVVEIVPVVVDGFSDIEPRNKDALPVPVTIPQQWMDGWMDKDQDKEVVLFYSEREGGRMVFGVLYVGGGGYI